MGYIGTYQGYLFFMEGELYVGWQEGQPHVEFSLPAIGVMHTAAKDACFQEDRISFVVEVNALDGTVELQPDGCWLTGELFIREVNMRFPVKLKQSAKEYCFCPEYYKISEENRNILRNNSTYTSGRGAERFAYELNNEEVRKAAQELGITVENHQDFATIYSLMLQTEQVIHQDGVNYCHSSDHGTLAQLKYALAHNNYTNCRGISIVFSGILRAYGFRSSYVECWPADPNSQEIHVVCEAYAPDLKKYVAFDISNRMVFYRDGMPLSLLELREAIAAGEEDSVTCNEDARNSLDECLAYLSKNLVVFCKQRDNNETDEIESKNSVCLAPEEQKEAFSQRRNIGYITSSPGDFYA